MAVVHSEREPFVLREQPFAPTADPSYFYATRDHKSCLFRLWGSIDNRSGIAVVLGNYGTGKTTLLRKLITGMTADPDRYSTAVIGSPIPSWTSFALLEAIVRQFGLRPSHRSFAEYMEALNQYLLANRNKISTLIIDDAQNLNKRGQLELLRLAQNLETPQHKLLNLVFFSQLEWKRVLAAAPNFAQRINLTYTLQPLALDEVKEFIAFRLQRAGADVLHGPGFSDNAIEMIHTYSDGNPRVIVTLCRNALMLASRLRTMHVDNALVMHTIEKTMLDDPDRRAMAMEVMQGGPAAVEPSMQAAAPAMAARRSPVVSESPFKQMAAQAAPSTRRTPQDARANDMLRRAAMNKRQAG
jgi:general secretion pathway protein A